MVLNRDAAEPLGAVKSSRGAANLWNWRLFSGKFKLRCRQIVLQQRKGAANQKRLRNTDLTNQSKEVSVEDVFGVFDTGGNFLGVVEALDDVEWDSEGHQLGGLVNNVVRAVEDQVPENSGDDLDCRKWHLKKASIKIHFYHIQDLITFILCIWCDIFLFVKLSLLSKINRYEL